MRSAILAILLAGCSDLVKVAEPKTVQITWNRVLPKECGKVKENLLGCATTNFEFCTIQMPENSPDWVVAEEFRHCFGEVHPDTQAGNLR